MTEKTKAKAKVKDKIEIKDGEEVILEDLDALNVVGGSPDLTEVDKLRSKLLEACERIDQRIEKSLEPYRDRNSSQYNNPPTRLTTMIDVLAVVSGELKRVLR